MSSETAQNKELLTTFIKGLKLIKSFQYTSPALTLSEVAEINDISRASARRFLLSLESMGYVEQENKRFHLTAKVLELGYGYAMHFDLSTAVNPALVKLSKAQQVSCSVSVLDDTDVIYISRSSNKISDYLRLQVGAKLPSYASAAGRLLLSYLSDEEIHDIFRRSQREKITSKTITEWPNFMAEINKIRQVEHAIVNQELDHSLRTLAVIVKDSHDQPVMSLNISGHLSELSFERINDTLIPAMQQSAKTIQQLLPR